MSELLDNIKIQYYNTDCYNFVYDTIISQLYHKETDEIIFPKNLTFNNLFSTNEYTKNHYIYIIYKKKYKYIINENDIHSTPGNGISIKLINLKRQLIINIGPFYNTIPKTLNYLNKIELEPELESESESELESETETEPEIKTEIAVIFFHKDAYKIYKKNWILNCIYSVLNQNCSNFDIFEVNYGNSDESLFKDIKYNTSKIKLHFYKKNYNTHTEAMMFLLNKCFYKFNYKYIFNTNIDDYYSENRFKLQIEDLQNNNTYLNSTMWINICNENDYSQRRFIYKNDKFIWKFDNNFSNETYNENIKYSEIKENVINNKITPINHSGVCFTKNFWNSYDKYRNKLKYRSDKPYEDISLWTRALENNIPISIVNKPLIFYRLHSNQITSTINKQIIEPNLCEFEIGILLEINNNNFDIIKIINENVLPDITKKYFLYTDSKLISDTNLYIKINNLNGIILKSNNNKFEFKKVLKENSIIIETNCDYLFYYKSVNNINKINTINQILTSIDNISVFGNKVQDILYNTPSVEVKYVLYKNHTLLNENSIQLYNYLKNNLEIPVTNTITYQKNIKYIIFSDVSIDNQIEYIYVNDLQKESDNINKSNLKYYFELDINKYNLLNNNFEINHKLIYINSDLTSIKSALVSCQIIELDDYKIDINTTKTYITNLPYSIDRKEKFIKTNNTKNFEFVNGIKYTPGVLGCGITNKLIINNAKRLKLEYCKICEDDCIINNYEIIETALQYLLNNNLKFELLSCYISKLTKNVKIEEVINLDNEFKLIKINEWKSNVYNIYHKSAYNYFNNYKYKDALKEEIDAKWNEKWNIDRFINFKHIWVIYPYPVNIENITSIIWKKPGFSGENYNAYNNLKKKSYDILNTKLVEYKNSNTIYDLLPILNINNNNYYKKDDSFYKNPIIMIVSCLKNKNRIQSIYQYWLKKSQIQYKIIIAEPTIDKEYIEYNNYIILKCNDDYNSLSVKVKKGMSIIYKLFKPDCIIKCDDDVFIYLSKLYDFLKFEKNHYMGNYVTFHNLHINNKIINLNYCGGPLYFLDKLGIQTFINDINIYNKNEDINIAYTLYLKNIIPYKSNKNIYQDMMYGIYFLNKTSKNEMIDNNWYCNWLTTLNKTIGEHYQYSITKLSTNIYVELSGGLGNRLFQLAFIINMSLCYTNLNYFVYDIEKFNHNVNNYELCKKIIQNCNINFIDNLPNNYIEIKEKNSNIYSLNIIEDIFKYGFNKNIKISKYFQSEKYFSENYYKIKSIFEIIFDKKNNMLKKYNNINFDNSYFLHIRGGDYCNNSFHEINLEKYINLCIKKIYIKNNNNNINYIVFTNDNKYAKNILEKLDIQYTIINDDAVNSIHLMSMCKLGGICSNSTFSWWSAWFNKERDIYMPYNWFGPSYPGEKNYNDIYFDNVNIIKDND